MRAIVEGNRVLCQRTCLRCGGRTFERPIVSDATPQHVHEAIARDEIERAEDTSKWVAAQRERAGSTQ